MNVTLDFVEKLDVDPQKHFNEIRTLQQLSKGLMSLATGIRRREQRYEALAKVANFSFFGGTSDQEVDDLNLVACIFHWFGVSAINYARLVGFIRGLELSLFVRDDLKDKTKFKHISKAVKAYVESVSELSSVLIWRNKVAGHFAITDPWHDDNIATLNMSVMFPVTMDNGFYNVGGTKLTIQNAAGVHVSAMPMWSVTKVFESLLPRYWPNVKFVMEEPQALKEPPT
jgi:hypothetical protein